LFNGGELQFDVLISMQCWHSIIVQFVEETTTPGQCVGKSSTSNSWYDVW